MAIRRERLGTAGPVQIYAVVDETRALVGLAVEQARAKLINRRGAPQESAGQLRVRIGPHELTLNERNATQNQLIRQEAPVPYRTWSQWPFNVGWRRMR